MARKPSDIVQLKLRFPEKLRRRLEHAAERNKQSMNSEIVALIEQALDQHDLVHVLEQQNAKMTKKFDSLLSYIYAREEEMGLQVEVLGKIMLSLVPSRDAAEADDAETNKMANKIRALIERRSNIGAALTQLKEEPK